MAHTPGRFPNTVTGGSYREDMSTITNGSVRGSRLHPEPGRRYSIEELTMLADQGDAWAMCKVDEWERSFANAYAGDLRDVCPDADCEHCGEPVNICYGEDGAVLDVDHGGWAHYPGVVQAKAS